MAIQSLWLYQWLFRCWQSGALPFNGFISTVSTQKKKYSSSINLISIPWKIRFPENFEFPKNLIPRKLDIPKSSISVKTRLPEKLDIPKTQITRKLDSPKTWFAWNTRLPENPFYQKFSSKKSLWIRILCHNFANLIKWMISNRIIFGSKI